MRPAPSQAANLGSIRVAPGLASCRETKMSIKNHDFTSLVCIYAQLLPRIRETAKQLGYAVAIHGTMQRDFDLLATPWVEEAASPEELVNAIRDQVGGFIIGDLTDLGRITEEPTRKPHGRLSWNICWGGKPFIDLSITPRQSAEKTIGW